MCISVLLTTGLLPLIAEAGISDFVLYVPKVIPETHFATRMCVTVTQVLKLDQYGPCARMILISVEHSKLLI